MIAVNSNSMELESILLLKQSGLKNQLKFLLNFEPQLDAKAWNDRSGRVAMSKLKENPKTDNLSWDLKKITWTERMPLNEWLTNSNSPALPLNYTLSFLSLPLTLLFLAPNVYHVNGPTFSGLQAFKRNTLWVLSQSLLLKPSPSSRSSKLGMCWWATLHNL